MPFIHSKWWKEEGAMLWVNVQQFSIFFLLVGIHLYCVAHGTRLKIVLGNLLRFYGRFTFTSHTFFWHLMRWYRNASVSGWCATTESIVLDFFLSFFLLRFSLNAFITFFIKRGARDCASAPVYQWHIWRIPLFTCTIATGVWGREGTWKRKTLREYPLRARNKKIRKPHSLGRWNGTETKSTFSQYYS